MNKMKIVLAYSGGLDTTIIIPWLKENYDCEVIAVAADVGQGEELAPLNEKAIRSGAAKIFIEDLTEEFVKDYVFPTLKAGAIYEGKYLLGTSFARPVIAKRLVEIAEREGATAICHGCTGKGNDQVRFDLTFEVFAPQMEIITPTRDMKLSREYEINYLKENGFEADFTKMQYSINKGVWGTSVGGKETLCSATNLPDEAYPSQLCKEGAESLEIEFEKGEVVAVNGEAATGVKAINKLEAIGAAWAIGRDTHVGDTIVGIKGRVGFEAAAPMLIIKAHELLEKHTLTKWQQYWKDQLGTWYGMFMHEAMYSEPVMRDIEKFLDSSQRNVTGKVFITLRPYTFSLVGIESKHDLMNAKFAEYGEVNNAWTADDVKGFTKIFSMPLKIYHAVNEEE